MTLFCNILFISLGYIAIGTFVSALAKTVDETYEVDIWTFLAWPVVAVCGLTVFLIIYLPAKLGETIGDWFLNRFD